MGNFNYTWDPFNRLTQVATSTATTTYQYTAEGKRVLKEENGSPTYFLNDSGNATRHREWLRLVPIPVPHDSQSRIVMPLDVSERLSRKGPQLLVPAMDALALIAVER